MARSTDITSFSDYRQHLKDHFMMVKESGRPLFVTRNGRTDGVLLSPEAYDALIQKAELADSLTALARGASDMQADRGKALVEGIAEVAKELGLQLDD